MRMRIRLPLLSILPTCGLLVTFAVTLASPLRSAADDLDEARATKILEAFNSMSSEIVSPLKRDQIHIQNGQGRVDVNPAVKFSYFIQTLAPENPASPILLMPMATSRYTPTYYQTDEWWDAHKAEIEKARREGLPVPKQDMDEVVKWLAANKLSTNPYVIEIASEGHVQRTRLQDYLRDFVLRTYASDGLLTLYRGGEKQGEIDFWQRGERPRGARYWTPTANYAWRYARKNPSFLADLVDGRAPLFVFKVPVPEFIEMTSRRWPRLTLGTELTKHAHSAFDSTGIFKDHLYEMDYLGDGQLGVEIEVRSNRSGADQMARLYQGAVSIETLANDRIDVLRRAEERLTHIYPERAAALASTIRGRMERTLAEARLLIALREKMPREAVTSLLAALPMGQSEIAYIDTVDLNAFVAQRLSSLPSDAAKSLSAEEIDRRFGLSKWGGKMTCERLFR